VRHIESAGLDSNGTLRKDLTFEFSTDLEFYKTLKNYTRRFRRILDMEIFSKSSITI
jgi:hypothetical protein